VKNRVVWVLMTAMLLSLVSVNAMATPADTFVYAGGGDAETLDPAKSYDTASASIIFQLYDNLIQ